MTLRELISYCEKNDVSLDVPLALSINSHGLTGQRVLRHPTGVLLHCDKILVLDYDGPKSGTFHSKPSELMRPDSEFVVLGETDVPSR